MGGLWCDYQRNAEGGLEIGSPRNQQTNMPGLFAIGECDYQFHGANRLGANSLLACIFSGLTAAPGVVSYIDNLVRGRAAKQRPPAVRPGRGAAPAEYVALLRRPTAGRIPIASMPSSAG